MMTTYVPLLMLFAIAALVAVAFFAIGPVLGHKRTLTPEKLAPFECGSDSTGARHVKPSVKFYFTAILFVLFDVEAVFVYPWAVQFRSLGWGALLTMGGFLAALAIALVYVWKKGVLAWAK